MAQRLADIAQAIVAGDDEAAADLVSEALAEGVPGDVILNEGLVAGLREVGQHFEAGEAFLPEMLVSAEAMNRASAVLEPALLRERVQATGVVIIGTVEGDLHDIGKNLVAMMLKGNGFDVFDLGVDVSVAAFVEAATEHSADIIALSALLSTTAPRFADVIGAARRELSSVRLMVGGAAVNSGFARQVGADGYATDCVSAVREASRLLGLDL